MLKNTTIKNKNNWKYFISLVSSTYYFYMDKLKMALLSWLLFKQPTSEKSIQKILFVYESAK